ncbi:ATP-binding protein [uncultured Brevundimonas sp.]|uniref:ATP-binding protein n=1 Tax=uncultured Brevundimonas sp. TaxID=213418 RepID=UPI0025E9FC61|nr:ATP-binding protein [uncultured Brevundimonas sp.]
MASQHQFKVSSALKDIIGRDLITNDFVAIFELVKNAFDAHARTIDVVFEDDQIWIIDDGKGMSRNDLTDKWLFVAYSAKRTDEEDQNVPTDFRDRIGTRRGYAGNKGIGRFSCDRLGQSLDLYSRPLGGKDVQRLELDWREFEVDAKQEFASVDVELATVTAFPKPKSASSPQANGTALVIGDLREAWPREKLLQLRAYLAKLVNPFAPREDVTINVHAPDQKETDRTSSVKVNGPVGNSITDVLKEKTTRLNVEIAGPVISSSLIDRGRLIYRIEEDNPYAELAPFKVSMELFFLNRSAKATFTRRMGLEPVSFGSVFLFLNGFRVFPIGEENDDTFGIDRRKQQGYARYLGSRDILGRIDIQAPQGAFKEASSRDAGLVETAATVELKEAVIRHLVTRLERYVVDVTWPDKLDTDRSDTSGLASDTAKARIVEVVRLLAGRKNLRLLDYDRDLVDTVNERAAEFERTMSSLAIVAERTGDQSLLDKIERSRHRYDLVRQAEADARRKAEEETAKRVAAEAAAREAQARATTAEQLFQDEKKRSQLLTSLQGRDSETLTLLHHQVIIYATAVQDIVANNLRSISKSEPIEPEKIAADLETISFQNSRILAVTRFATQANFKLKADEIIADLVQFMDEYTENITSMYEGDAFAKFAANGHKLDVAFKPIDISIVIDNLISNARKAKATRITFDVNRVTQGEGLQMVVEDNGRGIDRAKVDQDRIFEKGYSGTAAGSGLGLYHVAQVLSDLGGSIGVDPAYVKGGLRFLIRLPKASKEK